MTEDQTLQYEQTETGKGKCPYDPHQKTATAMIAYVHFKYI
ncbi:sema domain, immunoglobulin domain (Ig), short basic domain, secreted, (semaphorin) 3H [Tachysurus ichikawai]